MKKCLCKNKLAPLEEETLQLLTKITLKLYQSDKEFQAIYKDLSQYILSEFHGEKYKL